MPTRRHWVNVRDPFGGIGMTDTSTGDFVPIRQAAPKLVKMGRTTYLLTPPKLAPMQGVGSHVQDLDQIPWQVRNLGPNAAQILQGMLQGSGAAPTDVPPGGAAPNQPQAAGAAQGAPQDPRSLTQANMLVAQYQDATEPNDYDQMDTGDYGVQPPSQSPFGLPNPQTSEDTGDYTDTGDTSTIGYDEGDSNEAADAGYYGESYGDEEEDPMNRRRRVGSGQSEAYGGYEYDDSDPIQAQQAAEEALRAIGSRGSGSRYNGSTAPINPRTFNAPDFGLQALNTEPLPSKGHSAIKGDDGKIYSFNEDTGELTNVAPGSGMQEREFGLKERQLAQSDRQSSEANAIAREKIGVEREQNQIAADPRKFRLQPHVIDLGRGGTAVYDPETGMVQQVTPREPGDVRGIGRDIYVPAGQAVSVRYGLPGEAATRRNEDLRRSVQRMGPDP
jgi:hypothetical protein